MESFKEEVGITASEMFVGGSVGQGTTVPGHYDLDLVIFSRDLNSDDVVVDVPDEEKPGKIRKKGYCEIQRKLEAFLEKHLSPDYTYIKTTDVAVSFKYKQLEVDLLLSPYWETRGDYYTAMRRIPDTTVRFRWFSVSTSKYSTEFIRKHEGWVTPEKVQKYRGKLHELIRRAKGWRNETWKDGSNGRPKSYFLSLLMICAFDKVKDMNPITTKFPKIVQTVADAMIALVEDIASNIEDNLVIPGTRPEVLESDLVCGPPPRIVDPANPINNLYKSGLGGVGGAKNRWEAFNEKVKDFDISKASCSQLKK